MRNVKKPKNQKPIEDEGPEKIRIPKEDRPHFVELKNKTGAAYSVLAGRLAACALRGEPLTLQSISS